MEKISFFSELAKLINIQFSLRLHNYVNYDEVKNLWFPFVHIGLF